MMGRALVTSRGGAMSSGSTFVRCFAYTKSSQYQAYYQQNYASNYNSDEPLAGARRNLKVFRRYALLMRQSCH